MYHHGIEHVDWQGTIRIVVDASRGIEERVPVDTSEFLSYISDAVMTAFMIGVIVGFVVGLITGIRSK